MELTVPEASRSSGLKLAFSTNVIWDQSFTMMSLLLMFEPNLEILTGDFESLTLLIILCFLGEKQTAFLACSLL